MNLIVYIDLYFAINLSMDFIVLILVSKLSMIPRPLHRLLFGSLFGSLITCILIMYGSSYQVFYNLISFLAIPVGMLIITFGKSGKHKIGTLLLYQYAVTVVLGGILCLIFFHSSFLSSVRGVSGVSESKSVGLLGLVIAVAVVLAVIPYIVRYYNTIHNRLSNIFEVSLFLEGNSVSAKGLLDTGNHLREPISNKPAIIVEKQLLEQIMTKQLLEYTTRIRIIPFRSIGKEKGSMYGITIDRLTVYVNGEKHEFNKVVACVYEGTLSSKKDYQLILHQEFV